MEKGHHTQPRRLRWSLSPIFQPLLASSIEVLPHNNTSTDESLVTGCCHVLSSHGMFGRHGQREWRAVTLVRKQAAPAFTGQNSIQKTGEEGEEPEAVEGMPFLAVGISLPLHCQVVVCRAITVTSPCSRMDMSYLASSQIESSSLPSFPFPAHPDFPAFSFLPLH